MIRSIFFLMLWSILTGFNHLNCAVIPVSDANVQSGLSPYNWVSKDGTLSSTINAACFNVAFSGTRTVTLEIDSAHLSGLNPSRYPIIAWSVNGRTFQTHQLIPAEKSVLLCSAAFNPVIDFYIKGMSPFEDRFSGDLPINSLKITGFTVDSGATTKAIPQSQKLWLNLGDSIMSGDAAAYAKGQGRPPDDAWASSDDGRASYGYLLAKHFGYRETRIAYGGYNWAGGGANLPGLDQLIDQRTSTVSRLTNDVLAPLPNVVLVNLGENGISPDEVVIRALGKLRSRIGSAAVLFMMIPVSGRGQAELTRAFQTYQTAAKDKNAFLVDLGRINFATADGQHPTAKGNETIYQAALPKIDTVLKKK